MTSPAFPGRPRKPASERRTYVAACALSRGEYASFEAAVAAAGGRLRVGRAAG